MHFVHFDAADSELVIEDFVVTDVFVSEDCERPYTPVVVVEQAAGFHFPPKLGQSLFFKCIVVFTSSTSFSFVVALEIGFYQ